MAETDETEAPGLDFRCGVEALGSVVVSDRGSEKDGAFSNSVELVDIIRRIDFSVSVDDDEGPLVGMSTYHCVNPDTGVGYHVRLEIPLDRRTAAAMHKALGFLLELLDQTDRLPTRSK